MQKRQHTLKPVLSAVKISERVQSLAQEINASYKGEKLLVVCVLKGAFLFFSDLVRQLDGEVELDFVRISSYGKNTSSSGSVNFVKDLETDIAGRNVLVVEDLVDSGLSMNFLLGQLKARNPKSVKLAALIYKAQCRDTEVVVDFMGFNLDSGFLVGYGLDYAEQFRNLPAIYDLEFDS